MASMSQYDNPPLECVLRVYNKQPELVCFYFRLWIDQLYKHVTILHKVDALLTYEMSPSDTQDALQKLKELGVIKYAEYAHHFQIEFVMEMPRYSDGKMIC